MKVLYNMGRLMKYNVTCTDAGQFLIKTTRDNMYNTQEIAYATQSLFNKKYIATPNKTNPSWCYSLYNTI